MVNTRSIATTLKLATPRMPVMTEKNPNGSRAAPPINISPSKPSVLQKILRDKKLASAILAGGIAPPIKSLRTSANFISPNEG